MFALPAKSISCSCLSGLSLLRVKGVDRLPPHYGWKLVFQLFHQPPVTVAMSRGAVESVESGNVEKLTKFPKSVPLILSNVFFERFCSGGIFGELIQEARLRLSWIIFFSTAFLAIFLNQKLNFDANESTALYHVMEFTLYFFTIVGAIVADSWLGLYKTLAFVTMLFSVGAWTITVVSVDVLQLPMK